MLSIFAQFELQKVVKYFRTGTSAKAITSVLFLAVFLLVGLGIYSFLVTGFRYIYFEAPEDARQALFLFLYELFLIVLSGIIAVSALVSGIFNLFQKENNNWFISSPSFALFPKLVLIRSLSISLLPSAVMFVPAVLSLHKVFQVPFSGMIILLAYVALLLLTINSLMLLLLVALGKVYLFVSRNIALISFNFRGYIASLFFFVFIAVGFLWKMFANIDLVLLFKAEDATDAISIATIGDHFAWLPTHPIALSILHAQNGESASADFLIIALIAAVSTFLWTYFSKAYYPLWQRFQEGTSQGFARTTVFSGNMSYRFYGGRTMALIKKEALVFMRNFKGMLWFLFLFAIWLMQIGTSVLLRHNIHKYDTDISHKTITLEAIQFIIAVYFINAFVLRFVFPAFSVEKKTSWIAKTAPLSFKKLFFGKYVFYTLFFAGLGIVMSSVSMSVLGLPFAHAFYSMFLFIATVIFIVTFGLSLGALFPNLETDDPEAISTSMPGLFFTALSLLYGALSTWVLYAALTADSGLLLSFFAAATLLVSGVLFAKTPTWAKNKDI